MEILPSYEFLFYASLTIVFIISYFKETCADTAAKFEKVCFS